MSLITHPLVAGLVSAAQAAGQAILPYFRAGEEIAADAKSDGSPVTDADRAAEAVIIAALAVLDPATPVVAEEAMSAGGAPARVGRRFWCVDPLDGTRQFVAGLPDFAVCIGLVEDEYPVLGVLHLPADGRVVVGGAGEVWQMAPDLRRLTPRPWPVAPVAVGSRSARPGSRTARWLAERGIADLRGMGSAWKFAELASGAADIYYRPGETSEWDTAAGQAVLEAVGGRVVDLSGARLRYGKEGFRNTGFLACTGDAPITL
ncbi:MAG: 3'(2'),5'-bisphosphate nucleotidase CysQ [Alphaproteobacteria bacterium]|nr:3'(2'),5'-bisphosphate nucleotidase CysQ [Alphaproteobacteria bacterium]TAD91900.1 MAG: 3'(2'),5'-bisphosphate nucleotidase CysQ [Alphaproteobacteria bacterium]